MVAQLLLWYVVAYLFYACVFAICGALATQTPGDVEGYPDAAQMEAALTGAAITYR